jgi:hypothetical protein
VDPELFFPTAETGPLFDSQVAEAQRVCGGCPVREACLAWVVEALPHGVAGGLTTEQRRAARVAGRRAVA